jgi:hypothetical protein
MRDFSSYLLTCTLIPSESRTNAEALAEAGKWHEPRFWCIVFPSVCVWHKAVVVLPVEIVCSSPIFPACRVARMDTNTCLLFSFSVAHGVCAGACATEPDYRSCSLTAWRRYVHHHRQMQILLVRTYILLLITKPGVSFGCLDTFTLQIIGN